MFTVKDVYRMAIALVGDLDTGKDDEEKLTIQYMNILLQEALDTENSIRAAHGEPELGAAPVVEDIENGLVYHDSLVRSAFPYGIAWQFHQDAGNLGLASQYRNLFADAVERNNCFILEKYV